MKLAFITGASRGIGKAIASKLSQEGFSVYSPSRAEMDLSNPDSVKQFLANYNETPTVLINNAGENIIGSITDYSFDTWQRILNVNLNSVFLLIQHFAPKMAQSGYGRILNVSSCLSVKTRVGRAAYSSSKAGLNGLTRAAAVEYASKNVLINAMSPGFVDTELTHQNNNPEQVQKIVDSLPIARLAKPAEIAEFAHFLVSGQNSYITGQNILIDGGYLIV